MVNMTDSYFLLLFFLSNVGKDAEVKREVKLTARKPGKRILLVAFDSDQLSQVDGSVELEISISE